MLNLEKVIEQLEYMRDYHRSIGNNITADIASDALELLKEQEAVKPIYNGKKYGDYLPHCGNCEKVLPDDAVYGRVNFCHYCGKAVK